MENKIKWRDFEQKFSEKDIIDIEKRLDFLRDAVHDALLNFNSEDVASDLDLNLGIYLNYFAISGNQELSAWQIHDAWFYYHADGNGLSSDIAAALKEILFKDAENVQSLLNEMRECLDLKGLVCSEADVVIWLSSLDHLAVSALQLLSLNRMKNVLRHL